MNRRMLSFGFVLSSTLLIVGCDNNKTTSDKNQVPATSEQVAAIPPAPEPYVPPPVYAPPAADSSIYISPAPAPAPKPAASPKATAASTGKTYTVQKGETLTAIARKVYGNPAKYKDIAAANGITDPNKIKAGQVLTLP